MRLNAVNSYTGPTTVNDGSLKLGINNAIATNSVLAINASANSHGTFDLNGFSQTVAELSGAGTLSLGTGTFTDGDATSTTFSGNISGSGNFLKVGSSTLTLSGDSTGTFSGALDLQAASCKSTASWAAAS